MFEDAFRDAWHMISTGGGPVIICAIVVAQALLLSMSYVVRRRGALRRMLDTLDRNDSRLAEIQGALLRATVGSPSAPPPPAKPEGAPPASDAKPVTDNEIEQAMKKAFTPFVTDLAGKIDDARREAELARGEAREANARADYFAQVSILLGVAGIVLAVILFLMTYVLPPPHA